MAIAGSGRQWFAVVAVRYAELGTVLTILSDETA